MAMHRVLSTVLIEAAVITGSFFIQPYIPLGSAYWLLVFLICIWLLAFINWPAKELTIWVGLSALGTITLILLLSLGQTKLGLLEGIVIFFCFLALPFVANFLRRLQKRLLVANTAEGISRKAEARPPDGNEQLPHHLKTALRSSQKQSAENSTSKGLETLPAIHGNNVILQVRNATTRILKNVSLELHDLRFWSQKHRKFYEQPPSNFQAIKIGGIAQLYPSKDFNWTQTVVSVSRGKLAVQGLRLKGSGSSRFETAEEGVYRLDLSISAETESFEESVLTQWESPDVIRLIDEPESDPKVKYPRESSLIWKGFSDNDIPAIYQAAPRYTWIRIKKESGTLTNRTGQITVRLEKNVDFLTNVPIPISHEQAVSVQEKRCSPKVLELIGQQTLDLYNKGAALLKAYQHITDLAKSKLLRSESEEWFTEIAATLNRQISSQTADLVLGNNEGNYRDKIARRLQQLEKLVDGVARFKNCQESAIHLQSGEVLKPGEETFSTSFSRSELSSLLDSGSIERQNKS